jgi:hypothetical protein
MTKLGDREGADELAWRAVVASTVDGHTEDIRSLDERLGKILWALVGILISTSTAAVLLALNLVVNR